MLRCACNQQYRSVFQFDMRKLSVAGPALPDRAEEFTGREVAVLVEVLEPLLAAEAVLAVDEVLVALVLEGHATFFGSCPHPSLHPHPTVLETFSLGRLLWERSLK